MFSLFGLFFPLLGDLPILGTPHDRPPLPRPCDGFIVYNGSSSDTLIVETYLTYTLVSAEVQTLSPGDPIELTYTIKAHPCGDAEVVVKQYTILEDDAADFRSWLSPVRSEAATVSDSRGNYYQSTAPNGVSSIELDWTWSDGYWTYEYDNTGMMDTISIPAGRSITVTFSYPHTENATAGISADVGLDGIFLWRDVATDQVVSAWDDGSEEMFTTVEFVE